MKSTLKLPKKLQESPQEASREPKASKKLSQEIPNPPRTILKSIQKLIEIG